MADVPAIRAALAQVREGGGFAAHEVLEVLWRAADQGERDLYQGLVHVAVATYQEQRGNPVGRRRQLEKALRRLTPYAPVVRGARRRRPARVVRGVARRGSVPGAAVGVSLPGRPGRQRPASPKRVGEAGRREIARETISGMCIRGWPS